MRKEKGSGRQYNPFQYGPGDSSTSTSSGVTVPIAPISAKEAMEMRARLAIYDASQSTSGRRVTSAEDDGSQG